MNETVRIGMTSSSPEGPMAQRFYEGPSRNEVSDTVSEVIGELIFLGKICNGCLAAVEGEGFPCYCIDELGPILRDAHVKLRWCSEDCLIRTHNEPVWPEEIQWKE